MYITQCNSIKIILFKVWYYLKEKFTQKWTICHDLLIYSPSCHSQPVRKEDILKNESQQGPVLFWTPLNLTCMYKERFGTAFVWVKESFRWILPFPLTIHTTTLFKTAQNGVNSSHHLCTGPYPPAVCLWHGHHLIFPLRAVLTLIQFSA